MTNGCKLSNYFEYLIIGVMILASRTAWFGIIYGSETNLICFTVCVVYIVLTKRHRYYKKHISTCCTFLGILMFLYLYHFVFYRYTSLWIMPIVRVALQSMLLAICIDIKSYKTKYTDIMCWIAAISLLCYVILLFYPQVVSSISIRYNTGGYNFLTVSPYFTWGWYGLFKRNSGPFWEAGAFQCFLTLALLFVIYDDRCKCRKLKFSLLVLAMITTHSTTAYIILAIILIFWDNVIIRDIFKITGVSKSKTRAVMLPIILMIVILVLQSDIIKDKFSVTNQSYLLRSRDFENSLFLFIKEPLYGIGSSFPYLVEEYGLAYNSNGIFIMLYTYGIIFFICYCKKFVGGLSSLFRENVVCKKIAILFILVLIYVTQNVFWLPTFFTILYYDKRV